MKAAINVAARLRVVDSLARGSSKAQAARDAKTSRQQVYRFLKDPEFVSDVEDRKAELEAQAPAGPAGEAPDLGLPSVEVGEDVCAGLVEVALGALKEICQSQGEDVKPADRIRAAKEILAAVSTRRPARPAPKAEPEPESTPTETSGSGPGKPTISIADVEERLGIKRGTA